jgi:serine/threonine protein phosphatase 1
MLKRFERNKSGRDLIVGDIHGHFTRLQAALDRVGFDPDCGDRLFSVGDLVDRGPESDRVLDWLGKPWFHVVRGNHEQMAIDFAAGRIREARLYMMNGGGWNLSSPPEFSKEIAAAFDVLPIAIELDTEQGPVGIIHADCPVPSWADCKARLSAPGLDVDADSFVSACLWSRSRIQGAGDGEVGDIRAVVVGHTPMDRMTSLGNVIYIDTGGWLSADRQFTILDAATLKPAQKTSALSWA